MDRKKHFLIVTSLFVTLDLLHWSLNQVYQPYLGILDFVFHPAGYIGALWYGVMTVVVLVALKTRTRILFQDYTSIASLLLVAYCSFELYYMIMYGSIDSGSAFYYRMFPLFVAGVVPAVLTYMIASVLISKNGLFISLVFASILWFAGPFTIDGMNIVEGGARGTTSIIQNLPLVGVSYWILVFVYAVSAIFAPFLFFAAIAGGLYALIKNKGCSDRICIVALMGSMCLLSFNLFNWGVFIWD